jgi:hypothetical protein
MNPRKERLETPGQDLATIATTLKARGDELGVVVSYHLESSMWSLVLTRMNLLHLRNLRYLIWSYLKIPVMMKNHHCHTSLTQEPRVRKCHSV